MGLGGEGACALKKGGEWRISAIKKGGENYKMVATL